MNKKLMAARLQKGWSMRKAADTVRVGYRTWRYWEVEGHDPSLDSLQLLIDVFECSAEELGYGHLTAVQVPFVQPERVEGQEQKHIPRLWSPEQQSLSSFMEHVKVVTHSADSVSWFSERVAVIISHVHRWCASAVPCTHMQQIISQELLMFEKYVNPLEHPEEVRLARRQALMMLAALPAGMLTGFASSPHEPVLSTEELLPSCLTSITACWHLMAGRDFTTVERTLSQYFPLLATWAHSSSSNQRTSAYLAAQGYLLFGLVALHQLAAPNNFQRRFFYCQRAIEYAREAGDPALLVASLIHVGGAASDLGQPSQMLRFHQQAMSEVRGASPFLQSKLYAEIAYAYARNGQVQEALYHIAKARDLFPGTVTQDEPGFLSTDYGLFSLVLFEGQTLLEVGRYDSDLARSTRYYEQAQTALAQVEHMPPTMIFPERFRVEVVNQQTLADIKAGDLERFQVHLIEGARGAKVLRSEKRQQEVLANWKEARKVWPHEALVTELADLLLE